MAKAITIAHLSDVHLAPLVGFRPRHWNLKRFLGYVNWRYKRQKVHLRTVIDRLVTDLEALPVDHVVVTGDLVNIGLPLEYQRALSWLQELGSPDHVSVIPGNHDIYARLWTDPGVGRWAAYMTSDAWGSGYLGSGHSRFPYLRRIGDVALIGLNSAVVTRPGLASGKLGDAQIREAATLLQRLRGQPLFRLVMIHHPPLPGQALPGRALKDAAQFRAALEGSGAELVIHGHNHKNEVAWCPSHTHLIPVIGIASGSLGRVHGHEPLARYNVYRIAQEAGAWEIELRGRGLQRPDGPVVEIERRILAPVREALIRARAVGTRPVGTG